MKIQCEKCKQLVPLEIFQSSSAGIQIECSACAESFFVPARAPRKSAAAGDGCPKCQTPVPEGVTACVRCGLEVARFQSFVDEEQDEAPPELRERWQAVEGDWQNAAVHESFIDLASMSDAFGYAARRYRVASRESGRGAIADEHLLRIRRMAEAKTFTQKQVARSIVDKPGKGKGGFVMIVIALAVMTIAAVALMSKFSENMRDGDKVPANEIKEIR